LLPLESSFLALSTKAVETCRRWIFPVAVLERRKEGKDTEVSLVLFRGGEKRCYEGETKAGEREGKGKRMKKRGWARKDGRERRRGERRDLLRDRLDDEQPLGDLELGELGSEFLLDLRGREFGSALGNDG